MAYTILAHINNTKSLRKYRIPKSKNNENEYWVEILIDLERQTFRANRFKSNIDNGVEWEIYNDSIFPSSLLNELLGSDYPNVAKWDFVPGLKENGRITPQMMVKWAYLQNGYILDQDEDLLMRKPELIDTMHDLMIDEYSNRRFDLFKILKTYAINVFVLNEDLEAQAIFNTLILRNSNDKFHIDLVKHITKLKETS